MERDVVSTVSIILSLRAERHIYEMNELKQTKMSVFQSLNLDTVLFAVFARQRAVYS